MDAPPPRRRLPLGVVCFFWLFAVVRLVPFLNKDPSELSVYVTAAERMWANERIHRPEDEKPFTYPPFFAVPFLPFAVLPKEPWFQRTVWYAANLAVLWWLLRFIERRIRLEPGGADRAALFWVALLVLAGRHVSSVFENQSHDLLLLFVVALGLDATLSGRRVAGGSLVGAGAAMKATPLLFFVYFLWKRRWLVAAAVVVVFVALSLAPDLFFHSDTGQTYLEDWYDAFLAGMDPADLALPAAVSRPGVWRTWNALNQSLSGTIYRLFTPVSNGPRTFNVAIAAWPPETIKLVTYTAMAALLALFLFVTRRGSPQEDERERKLRLCGEFGLFLCGMVLFSPMSSKSHFCVLVIGQAFLVVHVMRRRDPIAAALLGVIAALSIFTTRAVFGRGLGNFVLACGPVTWTALLTALAIARVLHRSRPRPVRP
jgi:glycosyl transferase family 87